MVQFELKAGFYAVTISLGLGIQSTHFCYLHTSCAAGVPLALLLPW